MERRARRTPSGRGDKLQRIDDSGASPHEDPERAGLTSPERDHILAPLAGVDWDRVHDAYGPGFDTVAALETLVENDDDERREDAWNELWGTVCHQGSIYAASLPAAGCLARLVLTPGAHDRAPALILLAAIGASDDARVPQVQPVSNEAEDRRGGPLTNLLRRVPGLGGRGSAARPEPDAGLAAPEASAALLAALRDLLAEQEQALLGSWESEGPDVRRAQLALAGGEPERAARWSALVTTVLPPEHASGWAALLSRDEDWAACDARAAFEEWVATG